MKGIRRNEFGLTILRVIDFLSVSSKKHPSWILHVEQAMGVKY